MQSRFISAVTCSLTIAAVAAPSALAAATGGVPAGGTAPSSGTPAVAPAPVSRIHLAPVTSRHASLAYKGPVFEKTATGAVVPYQPPLPAAQVSSATGGSPVAPGAVTPVAPSKPQLLVPGSTARYVGGLAAAPMAAPAAIQRIVWAANQIIGLPYIYGGGHASFESPGYDCSGTVSFALHGANLLSSPADSSEFETWGSHGAGRWVAIFANPGHAYMTVAGLRLDTSSADDPSNQQGPRWRPLRPANAGFVVRHPLGL